MPPPQINYQYDYTNKLVRRDVVVNGTVIKSTSFLYNPIDGLPLEQITTLVGSSQQQDILYGSMPGDGLISRTDQDGRSLFYLKDAQKNIIGVIDDKGRLLQNYEYSAYGEGITGADAVNPFRFGGGLVAFTDDATGLVHMGNRWYDPFVGAWISEDPLRQDADLNLYRYAANNPGTFIDPTGLYWTFYQSRGELWYTSSTGDTPVKIGKAYAGHGSGLNNPAMQDVSDIGPLPTGAYTIGDPEEDLTKKGTILHYALPLTPLTNIGNRGGFLIHGDNPNKSAGDSPEGCPVTKKSVRQIIHGSGDNLLIVAP